MYFSGKITFVNLLDVKLKIATHQGGIVWHIVHMLNYTPGIILCFL